MVLPIVCHPPTSLKKEFIHLVKVSSASPLVLQLLDSAFLEALLHSCGHCEAGATEAACLAANHAQTTLGAPLEPFEQATKGRDSKWVEPRIHVGI